MDSINFKDASGTSRPFAAQTLDGKSSAGYWSRSVPEGGCKSYANQNLGGLGVLVSSGLSTLYGFDASNDLFIGAAYPLGGESIYLKFYDTAGTPQAGDVPKMVYEIPSGRPRSPQLPPCGIAFALGIGVRATMGIEDGDDVYPALNGCVLNLFYQD